MVRFVRPPSLRQVVTARLAILLGYDVGLGLALGLILWAGGVAQVLTLTLSCFMPLLLIAGITLVLALRLSPHGGSPALAYGCWLLMLLVHATFTWSLFPLPSHAEVLLGGIGIVLMTFALFRFHVSTACHIVLLRTRR